jgi:hypothetical protein
LDGQRHFRKRSLIDELRGRLGFVLLVVELELIERERQAAAVFSGRA